MKISAFTAFVWAALVATVYARNLQGEANGEVSYVDNFPIGEEKTLVVTIDLEFNSGALGGRTYFTLSPEIAGPTSIVRCDAILERESGISAYDMVLELRKGNYPSSSSNPDCFSDTGRDYPDEEGCEVTDFDLDGETVHGVIELADEEGGGSLGNALEVNLLCTAVTPAPTPAPVPATPQPSVVVIVGCDDTAKSGGFGTTLVEIDLGTTSGTFTLFYEMYSIPDELYITYEGSRIFDTSGFVSGSSTQNINYSGSSTMIEVTVIGSRSGTAWDFSVSCPPTSAPVSSPTAPTTSGGPAPSVPTTPTAPAPITSPTAPAPSPSPGPTPCFSEKSLVTVLKKGPTPMKELKVGEKVEAGSSGTYEIVYGFAHIDKASMTNFLQIFMDDESSMMPLEITGDHLLSINGQMVPASSVKKGDTLQGINGPMKVSEIKSVTREGLYAPLTPSGVLNVNGVVASNYVLLQRDFSPGYLELQGGIPTPLTQHSVIHIFLSPLRMACMGVHSGLCSEGWIKKENGYHSFVDNGMKFVEWVEKQSALVQLVLLGIFLLVWGPLYALEYMFGASAAPFAAAAGVAGLFYTRRQRYTGNGPVAKRIKIA